MKDLVKSARTAISKLRAFNFRKAFSFALLEFSSLDGFPASGRGVGALVPLPLVVGDRRR